MEVTLTPQFKRHFRKLPKALQEEAFDKILLFKDLQNHASLRVHKLSGKMIGSWSFSVNYRYRIVFVWEQRNISAILLAIGNHAVYE